LEKAAKAHQAECVAQKVRKEVEAKAREEAKKKRITEKKKKKILKYLQQPQDKILAENATLLESAEESQITGSKYKEVTLEDDRDCQPSKKAKETQPARYHRDIRVKMKVLIPVRDVCVPGRIVWYIIQDESKDSFWFSFLLIIFFIASLLHVLDISLSNNDMFPIPTPTLQS